MFKKAKKENYKKRALDYYNYLLKLEKRVKSSLKESKLIFHDDGLDCSYYPDMFPYKSVGISRWYEITKLGIYKLEKRIKKYGKFKMGE